MLMDLAGASLDKLVSNRSNSVQINISNTEFENETSCTKNEATTSIST